ncbi:LysE/ArgO family amino acid transporter [Pseudaestuariivita sp.]|uniref:LysE/ArgO family amino acid transporter n=1 Tax=Pseudaestuariivita sp. TaxID=2211669 RepID=UPI004057E32D
MTTFFTGFATGFGLILAIGAQNAFVLRQGLRREHVFAVCLACAVSDAILIFAGVVGLGALLEIAPWFEPAMRYGGAAFLIWYGARAALSAWRGGQALEAADAVKQPLMPTLLTVLALTWLNPHVYLDTVILVGSIAASFPQPLLFGVGAMVASFVFFFSLGYGARLLAPLFARPGSWRVLDAGIALVMWAIALKLLL